jgi:fluoride exporter
MLSKLLYLGLAGAFGTFARYFLSGFIQKNISTDFPIGTTVVNITGCILFGLLWAIMEDRITISGQTRTIVFLGFFGAFTTFSSYAFETSQLLDESQWIWAAGNILIQNITGISGMIAGLAIGKWI